MTTSADHLSDTMSKMQHNHAYEREKMSRVIRRLVRYADRVAERHPQAVTITGQNARVEGGLWLAQYEREMSLTSTPKPAISSAPRRADASPRQ